uniref:F5/8 type C domain-containing protein n=1 Tax=Naja naja TaxID=35670 RepID=A0A8C6XUJ8_NAJNA
MQLIIWAGLLAVSLLAGSAAAQSCRPPPIGIKATNVALGKPAYQSSVQPHEILGSAEKAVDGNCSGNWSQGSCIRTKHEAQPWWYVDLGDSYKISVVVVKNPKDCCRELINHLEVRVGDTLENHGRSNALCGIIPNIRLGSITTIYCNGQEGRYVSVHLPGVNSLVLCEVEVYGTQ